jgi:hypothetical protein
VKKESEVGSGQGGDDGPPLTPELLQIQAEAVAALRGIRRYDYTLGVLFGAVKREGLAEKAKFKNPEDFWLRHVPTDVVGLPAVKIWAGLASVWSSDVCNLYKMDCLDLLRRTEQRLGRPLPADPGDKSITFTDDRGALVTKAFRDCSEQEMKLYAHGAREPETLPDNEQQFFDEVQGVVRATIGEDRGTKLTGAMVRDELFFTLTASRSWLPSIIVALRPWALEHGASDSPAPTPTPKGRSPKGR